jgi:hypothetical protein
VGCSFSGFVFWCGAARDDQGRSGVYASTARVMNRVSMGLAGTARTAGVRAGIGLHARFRYALGYARVIVRDDSLGLHAITPRAQEKRTRG